MFLVMFTLTQLLKIGCDRQIIVLKFKFILFYEVNQFFVLSFDGKLQRRRHFTAPSVSRVEELKDQK
jgi:hypothetical protein